ncbi:MAG: hypothetical protein COB37_06000 [Kordiimonadales bacterium]|nr:MAG: hypothetical protein COB37_06000 [Kordiimonadales bacterium]
MMIKSICLVGIVMWMVDPTIFSPVRCSVEALNSAVTGFEQTVQNKITALGGNTPIVRRSGRSE